MSAAGAALAREAKALRNRDAAITIDSSFLLAVDASLIGRLENVPNPQSGFRNNRSGAMCSIALPGA